MLRINTKKPFYLAVVLTLAVIFGVTVRPSAASAAAAQCFTGSGSSYTSVDCSTAKAAAKAENLTLDKNECYLYDSSADAAHQVTVIDCTSTSGNCANPTSCDLVSKYLNPFVKFLSALVGIIVVIAIISGAIQYSTSGGDPQKAAAGKKHITNAIFALVIYILLAAMLNFLIPGGL
ncbi:MAG TPA: hypothetical protein VG992_04395 [Candidatus Saccharimonadales bacterium]|nr:hypothetical protein [Candidatus Saccharimonadales bacterium]